MNDASGRPAVSPERTALRSTIVAVVLLDASPDWDRVGEMLAGGTLEAPAFRHRVVDVPFGLAPPRWAGEHDSDLPWQLDRVTLPASSTFDDVLEYARTAPAGIPEHPRWELTLVEGLLGGQSALLIRIHHAYADGADGTHITARIVDLERNRPHEPEAEPSPGTAAPQTADGAADRALTTIGSLVESVTGLVQNLAAPLRRLVSPGEPGKSDDRRLHVADVPLAELREAATRAGSTLDSAFLAAVLLGLADYRFRRGTDVDELSLAMPLADAENGGTGISLSRADLPVPADDPALLMRLLDEYSGPATEPGRHLAPPPNLLPAVVDDPLDHDDVFACTVPGSHVPLYVAGAKIEKYYGFGPTLGASFNVTLMSYLDSGCLGFTVDAEAVRDPAMFDDCIRAGLRAVLES